MDEDFVVKGTQVIRASHHRQFTTSRKDFRYYTKLPSSSVDETLFSSHHPSALDEPIFFPAPLGKRKTDGKNKSKAVVKRGPPLLWAPPPSEKDSNQNNSGGKNSKMLRIQTINGVPLSHQFRHLKHTPTFVDETLFGEPLGEPTFKAPWEEKKKPKQVLSWYPDQMSERKQHRQHRPATALGLCSSTPSGAFQVWKP